MNSGLDAFVKFATELLIIILSTYFLILCDAQKIIFYRSYIILFYHIQSAPNHKVKKNVKAIHDLESNRKTNEVIVLR